MYFYSVLLETAIWQCIEVDDKTTAQSLILCIQTVAGWSGTSLSDVDTCCGIHGGMGGWGDGGWMVLVILVGWWASP